MKFTTLFSILLLLTISIIAAQSSLSNETTLLRGKSSGNGIQCLDNNGNAVDWFVMLKFPILTGGNSPAEQNGFAFAYMDPTTTFQVSNTDLQKENHALAFTLNQIYNQASSIAYMMYNDQPPTGSGSDSRGHTKGEIGFDSNTGFWLLHSVPRWPDAASGKNSYDFPDMEQVYGQSFICVSFPAATFEDISQQLTFTYPQIYDSNAPTFVAKIAPTFNNVIAGKHVAKDPYYSIKQLVSLGGVSFMQFAKNKAWNEGLYEDLVAPTLKDNLRTETWQNGVGRMPSNCNNTYDVLNVLEVKLNSIVDWTSTKDHSKWAISSSKSKWSCIGGINRQFSQAKRPGGTLCSQIPQVWQALNSVVAQVESCP